MGYRSDVGAVIKVDRGYPNPDRVFTEFIGKVKLIGDDFFEGFSKDSYGWGDRRFIFFAENIKWYNDFSEIRAFDAIWKLANETDGLSGCFIRIGEEYDDIETDLFGIDPPTSEVYPVRHVHIDADDLLGKRNTNAQKQETESETTPQLAAD